MRKACTEAPKLLLVGLLCTNLACAGASGPKSVPAAADPTSADASNAPPPPLDPEPPKPASAPSDSSAAPAPAKDTTASADPNTASGDAATPANQPKKKKAVTTQAQRQRQNNIANRAQAGLEGMIIGAVIGAQIGGPIGAAAGAGAFGLWGVITGDVPFDSGRRSQPQAREPRSSDDQMENEVDDELKKQQDLEAEIEAELKHQEELLAAINKQEEVNKSLQHEAKDCAGDATPADPSAAPRRPCQREIPDSIFETKTVKSGKQEVIVKTLDADRDGRPEIKITIDPKSGQVLTREEDTDFDGTLDSVNTYLPDGRLASRAEDTNQDGKPDRWLTYDGGETAVRVEVDRNFDGKRDGYLQYQAGILVYEEYDNNGDGKIDRRIEYVAGKRSVEIEDTTLDGVMDARTFFDERGFPARIEKDKNQDGKTDVWEYFEGTDATKVVLVKREEDTNGDGVVDVTSYYEKGKLVRKEVADPSLVN
jgi:antitoxin component YwqK of YwqJK toxin-antitoxin module